MNTSDSEIYIEEEDQEEDEGQWLDCVADQEYQIWSEYPYQIRKKSNKRIVKESIGDTGYVCCYLNGKLYKKHRIVGLQFIPNDDPEHKTMIDHINHDRSDYHILNLRWVSRVDNARNMSTLMGEQIPIHDELPETAEQLDSYGSHWFEGLFIDYNQKKLFLFNGVNWRELIPRRNQNNIVYYCYDVQKNRVTLSHNQLFN